MDKPLYGLLNQSENRFYLITENHRVAKQIQFLLIKKKFFFCVNLEYRNINLDKDNCQNYGCSWGVIRNIQMDVSTDKSNDRYIIETKTPVPVNQDLLKNISLAHNVLNTTQYLFEAFKEKETQRLKDARLGLIEFEDFFDKILPNDNDIKMLVKSEISMLDDVANRLEKYRTEIIKILFEMDFFQNHDHMKKTLEDRFKTFDPLENFKTRNLIKNMLEKITR